MRYRDVDTVVFTDPFRGAIRVKDMRPIPVERVVFTTQRQAGEPFDLIASRPDVFGRGGEASSHKLHDAMAVEIVDRLFDYSYITKVRVPE